MTDTERADLDRFMAEKVMGFNKRESAVMLAPPGWSPMTDPIAASAVMARLTELGYNIEIRVYSGERPAYVLLTHYASEYPGHAPTWPEALCLAAQKAWEEKA